MRGLDLARSKPAQCALRRGYSDRFGLFEFSEAAVRGVPVALLHRVAILRDRRHHEAVGSAGILAGKTLAVGEQDLVATRTEFGAAGIPDARIEFQGRILAGACDLERAIGIHDSAVGIS